MSLPHRTPEVVPDPSSVLRALGSGGMPTTDVANPTVLPSRSWIPGQEIGRYLVIDELGHGGMGQVLRAYDPKLQREVALKILQVARMSELAQQRLVREARAMARLSHPNVVAVYDVEEDTEHGVVIAMEYVEGITLRRWLKRAPPWSEIVGHFIEAGRGLAAAHAVGLMHRDFKPSNVLVGSDGRVRVTDFGLARMTGATEDPGMSPQLVGSRESAESLSIELTEVGAVMGTPRFMSPEHHDNEALDATTDQYSFCVALWEGLIGTPPFLGTFAQLEDAKRMGPPPWPGVPGVPRRVAEALRRGLAAGRSERWPDIEALLEALEPRPRRWPLALMGAGLLGAAGLVWTGTTEAPCRGAQEQLEGHWDPSMAARAEAGLMKAELPYAADVWAGVEQTLDRYAEDWVGQHEEACEATAIRGEQSTDVLDLRMACLERARVSLRVTVDVLATADAQTVRAAHEIVAQLPRLSRCADVVALGERIPPPLSADEAAVTRVRERLTRARTLTNAGRYEEAATTVSEALEGAEAIEYAPLRTEVSLVHGAVLRARGQYEEAEAAFKTAMGSGISHDQWPESFEAASALVELVGSRMARPGEGLAYAETAWALLGRSVEDLGGEAELRHGLATIAMARGELTEAEDQERAALELVTRQRGDGSLAVAVAQSNLAAVLDKRGEYAEAEGLFTRARRSMEPVLGPLHPNVIRARHNRSTVLANLGRHAEAEIEQRVVLRSWEQTLGREHPNVAMIRAGLAATLRALGRLQESEVEHREAVRVFGMVFGDGHPNVGLARHNLANVLVAQGRTEEALAEYRAALSIIEEALGVDHPNVVPMQLVLAGLVMEREGGAHEARQLVERVWAELKTEELSPGVHGLALLTLARTVWAEDPQRARALAEQAREQYVQLAPGGVEELAELADVLAAWDEQDASSQAAPRGQQ